MVTWIRYTSCWYIHSVLTWGGGVCFLLQVTAADQLFSKMAVSKVSLQLAIYYACLQIYARTAESSDGEPLLCPPATLMSHVISHVIGHSTAEWPVGVQPAVELLQCYRTQLCDHVQAETLLGLGTGTYCYSNSGTDTMHGLGTDRMCVIMKWTGDWNMYDVCII